MQSWCLSLFSFFFLNLSVITRAPRPQSRWQRDIAPGLLSVAVPHALAEVWFADTVWEVLFSRLDLRLRNESCKLLTKLDQTCLTCGLKWHAVVCMNSFHLGDLRVCFQQEACWKQTKSNFMGNSGGHFCIYCSISPQWLKLNYKKKTRKNFET